MRTAGLLALSLLKKAALHSCAGLLPTLSPAGSMERSGTVPPSLLPLRSGPLPSLQEKAFEVDLMVKQCRAQHRGPSYAYVVIVRLMTPRLTLASAIDTLLMRAPRRKLPLQRSSTPSSHHDLALSPA